MIKRSAPQDVQAENLEQEITQLNNLVFYAQRNWGTKALSLASTDDIKNLVNEVIAEDEKQNEGNVEQPPSSLQDAGSKSNLPLAMAIGASRRRFSECNNPVLESEIKSFKVPKLRPQAKKIKKILPRSFIDIEFPPCDESINKTIIKSNSRPQVAQIDTLTGYDRLIHWRRPIEYITEPRLFPDQSPELQQDDLISEVKEISKGNIYHDWLISAIICLLEKNEQLIKRLFETKQYSENGIYRLSLYVQGRWQTITIDDYIPCSANGSPFFISIAGTGSIWLNLLEKACAKVFGGYKYLEGGSAIEALRMLTGAPLTSFCFKEASVVELIENESMAILIKDFLSKRSFVLVASTEPSGLFVKEKSHLHIGTAQQYTTQTHEYGSHTHNSNTSIMLEDTPPKGCGFAITGWHEQNGIFFLKMVDKWDLLPSKGKYGPQSALWTPYLQHEFDYDPV